MKLIDKMEDIDQKIPLALSNQIKDQVINYAYLLYKFDTLNEVIKKSTKFKID